MHWWHGSGSACCRLTSWQLVGRQVRKLLDDCTRALGSDAEESTGRGGISRQARKASGDCRLGPDFWRLHFIDPSQVVVCVGQFGA